jgi:uncharacterized protein (TIGR02231 family)
MRISLAVAMTALLAAVPALAAEVPATSNVEAVTVFPQSAEVQRVAKVKLVAGAHTIILSDLPQQAQAASIRVEGKATSKLEIGSVDSRQLAVQRRDPAAVASARRTIEAEIEKLRDERAVILSEQQAAESQRSFLSNLLQLPTRPTPAQGAGAGEDWSKVLALLAKELAPVNRAILEAGVRVRDTDRRIKDAEGRLAAEAPAQEWRTEVKIEVTAGQALDAEIAVRYQVAGASWTPIYDARLATGTKTAAPKIGIVRRAIVQQRTGEAWTNVTLALSTTRPTAGTAAPELRPITVDYPPDRPVSMPAAAPAPQVRSAPMAGVMRNEMADEAQQASLKGKVEEATVQQAQVEAGAFQAVYSIPGKQSLAPTGELRRLQIDETELDATLTVRAVPRVDERAFLYAKLTVPKATPWLPGQVALFRDGTFVGNGRVPQLGPGQDHELGFGADDRVRVKSASIEEKRSDTGIISSTRNETKSFKLTIKNLHERQIAFMIQDQLPVANNQEIKVELLAKPQPTKRDLDERRGVLAWEDKLNPDEEKAIDFGWRMSWPAAKSVVYGR